MIDNINLVVPLEAGNEWYKRIPSRNYSENSYSAELGNLKINQTNSHIKIQGSLGKYFHGNNIVKFTWLDVKQAIERLGIITGIDLTKAKLTRVEIGFCVILDHKVNSYISTFAYPRRYKSHRMGTIYGEEMFRVIDLETSGQGSKTGRIWFTCYNKTNEMKAHNHSIPVDFQGKNILRLEYRLIGSVGIQRKFKRNLVLTDLCNPEIYFKLQDLLYQFYKSIPKMGRRLLIDSLETLKPDNFKNEQCKPKDFESRQESLKQITKAKALKLWAYYQRQRHFDEYASFVQTLYDNNIINKETFGDINNVTWKEDLNYTPVEPIEIIAELDRKVEEALENDRKYLRIKFANSE
ncbi:phage/plasmid replication domain-containing protein [Breznakiella homolactica]|uniref:Replication-associated protein G2P N-terminal domain-containing protein n=1 Tax=Breznakiella homolactica TaxID=2798577 RepID=A0A7T7XNP2_9SPIR|nr:phage/plasmid replication protein [Breznakiella homolactica]QQO09583.1 hypothetical protein JFL75_01300 [Breznakiella homolactica]